MANPIPIADADVLAAQAKAGQAGVAAYEEAKANLTRQRQDAVTQAMSEAQQRGSPEGAMAAIQSTMTAPYDTRIAQLTQEGAQFQGAMSARDQRMTDYNASVQAARGLIGDQANLASAPIRAEGDFKVRLLAQQGQNDVDKINGQLRLETARFEAAAARAGGGGGGGGHGGGGGGGGKPKSLGTPNQTELARMLREKGGAKLKAAAQNVAQAMRQTRENQRQAGSFTAAAARSAMQAAAAKDRGSILGQQEGLRQAGSFTNRAMQEYQAQQARMRAEAQRQAASWTGKAQAAYRAQGPTAAVPGRQAANPAANFNLQSQVSAGAAAGAARTAAGRTTFNPTAPRSPATRSMQLPSMTIGGVDPVAAARSALAQIAQQRSALKVPTTAQDALRGQMGGQTPFQLGQAAQAGDRLTPEQMAWYAANPDAALYEQWITPGQNPVGSYEELGQRAGGEEYWTEPQYDEAGNLIGRPELQRDPRSVDAMRTAMELAGADLMGEGYKIDEPGLTAALGAEDVYGKSFKDISRDSLGLPTRAKDQAATWDAQDYAETQVRHANEDAYTNEQRSYTADQRERTRLGSMSYSQLLDANVPEEQWTAEQRRDNDVADFESRTNLPIGQVAGDPAELADLVYGDDYKTAEAALFAARNMPETRKDLVKILGDAGLNVVSGDPGQEMILSILLQVAKRNA